MSLANKKNLNILLLIFVVVSGVLNAQENILLQISVRENYGLDRELEYVELSCQFEAELLKNTGNSFYVQELSTGETINCQVSSTQSDSASNKVLARVIFPVSFKAYEKKEYFLKTKKAENVVRSDLTMSGHGTELVIENQFYRADLRKMDNIEPQSYMSGQIRELLIKMGSDQLLTNVEDRLHWAPNFKRPSLEYYVTIAHWQLPKIIIINSGHYQISTLREDLAPQHPEILLTAQYRFYADLPYFRFYSRMEMQADLWLELLRNDEMAMDSMFTHMAFQRPNGEIIDLEFSERYELLKNQPIENESPWICFYNIDKGFAFGSIRVNYDNTNIFGETSPTYQAHTQIGEWLGGIKYWNRRLVHDHLTFIPKGSRYVEDNVYLVFKLNDKDKLHDIKHWAERVRSPLRVTIEYL